MELFMLSTKILMDNIIKYKINLHKADSIFYYLIQNPVFEPSYCPHHYIVLHLSYCFEAFFAQKNGIQL